MDANRPIALYCELCTIGYSWLSAAAPRAELDSPASGPWTALDVTRLALGAYLVSTHFRSGFRTGWGSAPKWPEATQVYLQPRGLSAAKGGADTLYILGPNACLGGPEGHMLGYLYPSVSADEQVGVITWVCGAGGGSEIALWAEPIGAGADLALVEDELKKLRNAVHPLGFTAHVRIE